MDLNEIEIHRLLIIGNYGTQNVGDEAILSGILDKFKYVSTVEVVSYSPILTENFHKAKGIFPFSFEFVKSFIKSDSILIGGGGLFSVYAGRYGKLIPVIGLISKLLNKNLILYSLGAYSAHNYIMRKLYYYAANNADYLSVRDDLSLKYLQKIGVKKHINFIPDPALDLKPSSFGSVKKILKKEGIDPEGKYIGLSLRLTKNDIVNNGLMPIFIDIINSLIDENYELLFIPMSNHPYAKISQDRILAEDLSKLVKNNKKLNIIKGIYSPEEILGIFGRMNAIIGMRLHSMIFAHIASVPLIALIYDPKCEAFLKTIGNDGICIDELNCRKVIDELNRVFL